MSVKSCVYVFNDPLLGYLVGLHLTHGNQALGC
jgi:hypothetical protein